MISKHVLAGSIWPVNAAAVVIQGILNNLNLSISSLHVFLIKFVVLPNSLGWSWCLYFHPHHSQHQPGQLSVRRLDLDKFNSLVNFLFDSYLIKSQVSRLTNTEDSRQGHNSLSLDCWRVSPKLRSWGVRTWKSLRAVMCFSCYVYQITSNLLNPRWSPHVNIAHFKLDI